jgi:hypothetical protein
MPACVVGSFDADLIRPLGVVTLYFGYVEAEVNVLPSRLREAGVPVEVSPIALLVHASVLAKGRVVPNDPSEPEYSITPDDLTGLAEQAFDCKE